MNTKPILYSLEPFDPAGHRFRASITIPTPAIRGQVVSLPAWIPGSYLVRDFARQIETIEARSGTKKVALTKIGNHSWQAAPCEGALTITTTIYAYDLSVRSAHLDQTHAFLNGTSVFLRAHGHEHLTCLLNLLPPPRPARWSVFTSLPKAGKSLKKSQEHRFGRYQAENYDALIDHPIEMGTPQFARFTACGAEHELVFTGNIPNLDLKRISRDIKRICETQIRFFEPETHLAPFLDSAKRYVFMTMVTGDSYGGLEHRASTALMASRKDLPIIGQDTTPAGYETFLGLVSHEYFHTWHVKRIKPAVFAPYDLTRETHTRLLWIFEGFTSYYDDLMLFRSGVIDRPAYLKILGKQISSVWGAPGRHKQSVADSSFDAWTRYYKQDENSPNALVSYYTKGSLIALGLDLTIRHTTRDRHSLDDVMRLLWHRYGRDFYLGGGEGLAEHIFVKLVREACGVDVSVELQQWVHGTEDVPLKKLFARQGIDLQFKASSKLPSLDARVRKQGEHLALATVLEHGAAHLAGLSAMDALVAIDGIRVDASVTSLDALLERYQPGDHIMVHAFRRDELLQFNVRLAEPAMLTCELKENASQK